MPLLSAVLLRLLPAAALAAAGALDADTGVPALRPHVWVGSFAGATANMTFFGTDATFQDLVRQVRRHDPAIDAAAVVARAQAVARDNGVPEDLPDPGVPTNIWHGPGGPWTYGDGTVDYNYTCGQVATAGEYRTRDGAHQLRNRGTAQAVTRAKGCARHWCRDTTAMYVCNEQAAALAIPYYNVGWMADRLDRLCCDDNGGKSGRMWHYRGGYSVVLGYANCRTDAATSDPYPYGEGNNAVCLDGASDPHTPPRQWE